MKKLGILAASAIVSLMPLYAEALPNQPGTAATSAKASSADKNANQDSRRLKAKAPAPFFSSRSDKVTVKNQEISPAVTPGMTPAQMKDFFLEQTKRSLASWEAKHYNISDHPPFQIDSPQASQFCITPEIAKAINLREQVDAFAKEAQVSTAGVRENQNVLCPWDHRYRINEYMLAMMAESLSNIVPQLHRDHIASLPVRTPEEVKAHLGPEGVKTIENIFGMPLAEAMEFVRHNPIRIVGGETRSNTSRFVSLVSRIYAARGFHVFLTEDMQNKDTSTIFMWSFLTYMLGLSGGDYYTSSHGAPQKQSDKILGPDGSQYLPPEYSKIVEQMYKILEECETKGYTIKLAAADDPLLHHNLTYKLMCSLYADYLRKGPASPAALQTVKEAIGQGMRLKLDFFGGAGYKTIAPVLEDLGIDGAFEGGYIRTEEDPFFHNIGFRVAAKKGSEEYEVVHDSVDASMPIVVKSANYGTILKDAPIGQIIFNVDPDSDRFVAGQIVPSSEEPKLQADGISSIKITDDKLFALFSPNQFFLMLAESDRASMEDDYSWNEYSSFDIHTYVSALSWDEWAEKHHIPIVRTPVGFKEIAAIERKVEKAMEENPGQVVSVQDELGREIVIGSKPKVHHAGEESGGKIGGPRQPIYNILGQKIIAMREKSSGEACISAVVMVSKLYLKYKETGNIADMFLHNHLAKLFTRDSIVNKMEFRGDKIHYNEAIFDPEELAKAKAAGIAEKDRFNNYFRRLAMAMHDPSLTNNGQVLSLEQVKEVLTEAIPGMAEEWQALERIDVWSDGLQLWFKGAKVRDICLRPSGTDAKSKVYFDGTDKAYMENLFRTYFRDFPAVATPRYKELLKPE
ncbi:MAG: hypothetical protein ACI38Q_07865 [Candidatus Bruticola sp.]